MGRSQVEARVSAVVISENPDPSSSTFAALCLVLLPQRMGLVHTHRAVKRIK